MEECYNFPNEEKMQISWQSDFYFESEMIPIEYHISSVVSIAILLTKHQSLTHIEVCLFVFSQM